MKSSTKILLLFCFISITPTHTLPSAASAQDEKKSREAENKIIAAMGPASEYRQIFSTHNTPVSRIQKALIKHLRLVPDSDAWILLHEALEKSAPPVIQEVLQHQKIIKSCKQPAHNNGYKFIGQAAKHFQCIEIFKLLLQHGFSVIPTEPAQPGFESHQLYNPILMLMTSNQAVAHAPEAYESAQLLFEAGARAESTDVVTTHQPHALPRGSRIATTPKPIRHHNALHDALKVVITRNSKFKLEWLHLLLMYHEPADIFPALQGHESLIAEYKKTIEPALAICKGEQGPLPAVLVSLVMSYLPLTPQATTATAAAPANS
jgi:hypothetical protein